MNYYDLESNFDLILPNNSEIINFYVTNLSSVEKLVIRNIFFSYWLFSIKLALRAFLQFDLKSVKLPKI